MQKGDALALGFIKTQKITLDENGKIVSGSASIVDTVYGNYGAYHSKQQVRERLGRVFTSARIKEAAFSSRQPAGWFDTKPIQILLPL